MTRRSIVTLCAVCLLTLGSNAADYTVINNPSFPTHDMAVATYTATDYGIDNTGKTDCTAKVQQLLDKLSGMNGTSRGNYANIAGGILYFPEGQYLFKGQVYLPQGVTIRGDWTAPTADGGVKGTILIFDNKNYEGIDDQAKAFITMQPASEVCNLSIWYKNQSADDVKAYPPTILYGQNYYWGNDYCSVRHVTFVNSYTGVTINTNGSGGCPDVFDVYGTPLHQGIVIDCIADVGRLDGIHFSPKYWAESKLDNAPSENVARTWTYDNATGIVMRRNDWSYTSNFECDGYNVGFSAEPSPAGVSASGVPNGQNYNFNLTNCKIGVDLKGVSYCGMLFTRINTTDCEQGVNVHKEDGPASFTACHFSGGTYAVHSIMDNTTSVMLQQCQVDAPVFFEGGALMSDKCNYSSDVTIGKMSRTLFTGNTFSAGAKLDNQSQYECVVSDKSNSLGSIPEFKDEWMQIKDAKPAKNTLYIVDATPLSIKDDLDAAEDSKDKIQSMLNKAGSNGGGIVYLKPGHYKVAKGFLNIPKGVELKGASDIPSMPKGQGTILECMTNEGFENYNPFIVMQEGSGIRGITINYPNQGDPEHLKKYPYTIRGNKDTYIVNVAMRAAYRGIDLFTNKCDNHYVDGVEGHCFMNVIRIGGGSENGIVSNIQFNTGAYSYGYETKWGAWPNSQKYRDTYPADSARRIPGCQNDEQLDFMIVGDCKDEVLYNNFLFGCNKGLVFQKDENGYGALNVHAVGNAVDGAVNTFVFNGASSDIDLVNSQVVALNHKCNDFEHPLNLSAHFLTTGKDFDKTVTLHNSDFWGSGDNFTDANGGTLNLNQATIFRSGTVRSFSIANGANVNVNQGCYKQVVKLVDNAAMDSRLGMTGSLVNEYDSPSSYALWENNLAPDWLLSMAISNLKLDLQSTQNAVYTLGGVRVSKDAAIRAGVYIINGKKVLRK